MPPILYSYCVSYDNGSAPNPFWRVCTLAICKPRIRKAAKVGDWIAGTGSAKYGFENELIYAMEVTAKMGFKEYDDYCREQLPEKIPVRFSKDLKKKVGDCLYDFSTGKIVMRNWGAYQLDNMERDLSGEYVLLSDHFYYFGLKPIPLQGILSKIVRQGQGHKSKSNALYAEKFIEWITSTFKKQKNKVNANPYGLKLFEKEEYKSTCGKLHLVNDEADEKINHD